MVLNSSDLTSQEAYIAVNGCIQPANTQPQVGPQGPAGPRGYRGFDGPSGPSGPSGAPGSTISVTGPTGTLIVRVVHARDIKVSDSKASDPYALILFPNNKEHKTSIINNTLNPIWKETF